MDKIGLTIILAVIIIAGIGVLGNAVLTVMAQFKVVG